MFRIGDEGADIVDKSGCPRPLAEADSILADDVVKAGASPAAAAAADELDVLPLLLLPLPAEAKGWVLFLLPAWRLWL
jgi:hypothetical protein